MSHEGVFHRGSKLAKSKKSVPHHLCGSATIPLKRLKNINGQSWKLIKNLSVQPALGASVSSWVELAIFFGTFGPSTKKEDAPRSI